ncbi:3-oxoacyl-[acyl-carrier-protein] reductase FabG-like [Amblyomma americanum]
MAPSSSSGRRTPAVPGASSGIGEGTALHFASLGCWLALTARNKAALDGVAKKCEARGAPNKKVLVVPGDICRPEDVAAIVKKTVDHFGKIDILVSNAGKTPIGPLGNIALEEFDDVLNTNLRSAFNITQEVLPFLKKTKGSIVYVSSISTMRPEQAVPLSGISKAAVDQLTRASALEFAQYGIRANSVNPGAIDTKMVFRPEMSPEQQIMLRSALQASHALGRIGTVEEVARAIAFLASVDASFITGHSIPVDGGSLLLGPSSVPRVGPGGIPKFL